MGTIAAENKYSFLGGQDFLGVSIQIPAWVCQKIAMINFPHTQLAYVFSHFNRPSKQWERNVVPMLAAVSFGGALRDIDTQKDGCEVD